MTPGDLELVGQWLVEPHVARWYLSESTLEDELRDLRRCVSGEEPTHVLVVIEDGRAVGWCQWYRWRDYLGHATRVGAEPDDVGIDYAIGDPSRVGRGLGTALIAMLVEHIRERQPHAGVTADPEASNLASRRVLVKNGFVLRDERVLSSEPTGATSAIYRLPPPRPR